MRKIAVLRWVSLFAVCVCACCNGGGDDGNGDQGAESDGSTIVRVCAPGSTQECLCTAASKGVQICSDDGSRWGTCEKCLVRDEGIDVGFDAGADTGVQDAGPDGGGIDTGADGSLVDADGDANPLDAGQDAGLTTDTGEDAGL